MRTKEQLRAKHQRRRARRRAFLAELKDKPCADCGVSYPACVMDFDHVRGEKAFGLARCKTKAQTLVEAAKCDVVCANCHRIRTHMR